MLRLRNTFRAQIWAAMAAGSIAALDHRAVGVAHAVLDSSTPSNDEVLRRAPEQVVLTFSEPVETAFGSVRVYDGCCSAGLTTDARHDPIRVQWQSALPSDLRRGTYTVAWRVVLGGLASGQRRVRLSHRKARAGAAGVVAQVLDEQAGSQAVDDAFWVVRFLSLTLILLGVGGATRARGRALVRMCGAKTALDPLALASVLLALSRLRASGSKAPEQAGVVSRRPSPSLIGDVLDTRFGHAWLLRALLADALAFVAGLPYGGRCEPGRALAAVAVARVTDCGSHRPSPDTHGWRAESHSRATGCTSLQPRLGGWTWRSCSSPCGEFEARSGGQFTSRAVPRFSAVAVVSIACASGSRRHQRVLRGRLVARTVGDDVRSTLARQGGTRPTGARTGRVQQPVLGAAASGRDLLQRLSEGDSCCRRAVELALAVVIVGVTAALVAEPPAKAQLAGETGPDLT